MIQCYPLQLIALDEQAHQALDFAKLTKFDQIIKTEPKQLSRVMVGGYRQMLLLSALDADTAQELARALREAEDPIVILPETLQDSEEVRALLARGVRVVFSPASIVAASLSRTLNILESFFYADGSKTEIAVDHKDIYEVLQKGTVNAFVESSGIDISATMLKLFNTPKSLHDVCGIYMLFTISPDFPLAEISKAMDIAETEVPEKAAIILGTRHSGKNARNVAITCLVSRYFDFQNQVQEAIESRDTYLEKASVLVDAFYNGEITGEEANMIGERNGLSPQDLESIYKLLYLRPEETIALMRMVHDEEVSTARKIEAVADAVIDDIVDLGVVEEIMLHNKLSVDEVLSIVHLKREGKLPLQAVEIANALRDKYPDLALAKSADTPVLVNKQELVKEASGLVTVEADELVLYEKEGAEWFVSKRLSQDEIDAFVRELETH